MRPRFRTLLISTTMLLAIPACSSAERAETTGTVPPSVASAAWRVDDRTSDRLGPTTSVVERTVVDEVREVFDWLMLTRVHCGRRPSECAIDDLAVPGSAVHTALAETFDERVRHGIVASVRGSHRHRVTEVRLIKDDLAEVRACHTDDVVLVIGGSAGRPSAVYDESLVSHWSIWTLQRTDAGWRWTNETIESRIHGEDRCDW